MNVGIEGFRDKGKCYKGGHIEDCCLMPASYYHHNMADGTGRDERDDRWERVRIIGVCYCITC